jgi:hypothetical protein
LEIVEQELALLQGELPVELALGLRFAAVSADDRIEGEKLPAVAVGCRAADSPERRGAVLALQGAVKAPLVKLRPEVPVLEVRVDPLHLVGAAPGRVVAGGEPVPQGDERADEIDRAVRPRHGARPQLEQAPVARQSTSLVASLEPPVLHMAAGAAGLPQHQPAALAARGAADRRSGSVEHVELHGVDVPLGELAEMAIAVWIVQRETGRGQTRARVHGTSQRVLQRAGERTRRQSVAALLLRGIVRLEPHVDIRGVGVEPADRRRFRTLRNPPRANPVPAPPPAENLDRDVEGGHPGIVQAIGIGNPVALRVDIPDPEQRIQARNAVRSGRKVAQVDGRSARGRLDSDGPGRGDLLAIEHAVTICVVELQHLGADLLSQHLDQAGAVEVCRVAAHRAGRADRLTAARLAVRARMAEPATARMVASDTGEATMPRPRGKLYVQRNAQLSGPAVEPLGEVELPIQEVAAELIEQEGIATAEIAGSARLDRVLTVDQVDQRIRDRNSRRVVGRFGDLRRNRCQRGEAGQERETERKENTVPIHGRLLSACLAGGFVPSCSRERRSATVVKVSGSKKAVSSSGTVARKSIRERTDERPSEEVMVISVSVHAPSI